MTDHDDLLNISARFYDAVGAVLQGDFAPMLALWSRADDVSYCDTRGQIIRGRPALEDYWRRAAELNASAPVRLIVTGEVQQDVIGSEMAYVVTVEQVRREGEPGVMTARATNIYRREAGGWRLLHRHADAPPSMAECGETEEN